MSPGNRSGPDGEGRYKWRKVHLDPQAPQERTKEGVDDVDEIVIKFSRWVWEIIKIGTAHELIKLIEDLLKLKGGQL